MSKKQWRWSVLMEECGYPTRLGGNLGGWLVAMLLTQMVWIGLSFGLLQIMASLSKSPTYMYALYVSWFLPVLLMFWVARERTATSFIVVLAATLINVIYIVAMEKFLGVWRQLL